MSKKGFGQIFVIATIGGLVAAGISYMLQYKAFHKELEEEFHNFEEDELPVKDADRKYVALHADKDELVLAAKETATAAKGMASAVKGLIKDVGSILKDQAASIKSVASDSASLLKEKAEKHLKSDKSGKESESDILEDDLKDLEALDQAPSDRNHDLDPCGDLEAAQDFEKDSDESKENASHFEAEQDDFILPLTGSTSILEQKDDTPLPSLKSEPVVDHDVNIKDVKLTAQESTVIDLSSDTEEK